MEQVVNVHMGEAILDGKKPEALKGEALKVEAIRTNRREHRPGWQVSAMKLRFVSFPPYFRTQRQSPEVANSDPQTRLLKQNNLLAKC